MKFKDTDFMAIVLGILIIQLLLVGDYRHKGYNFPALKWCGLD